MSNTLADQWQVAFKKILSESPRFTNDLSSSFSCDNVWLPLLLTTDYAGNVVGAPLAHLKDNFEITCDKRAVVELGLREGDTFFARSGCYLGDTEWYRKLQDSIETAFVEKAQVDRLRPSAVALVDPSYNLGVAIMDIYGTDSILAPIMAPGTYVIRMILHEKDDGLMQMEHLVARVSSRKRPLKHSSSRSVFSSLYKQHQRNWFIHAPEDMNAQTKLALWEIQNNALLDQMPLMSSERGTAFPVTFTVTLDNSGVKIWK